MIVVRYVLVLIGGTVVASTLKPDQQMKFANHAETTGVDVPPRGVGSDDVNVAVTDDRPSNDSAFDAHSVSPLRELGAYEALWLEPDATLRSLAKRFAESPGILPSAFVSYEQADECAAFVMRKFEESELERYGVRVYGAGEYPDRLRDAVYPVELLYYQGCWDLALSRSVAVVGTRKPSEEGLSRTRRLVRELVADDFTVVSGLATGVDTMAHETAIKEHGRTIAVIGTPLSHSYPKENVNLQRYVAKRYLVISQIPLKRYESQDYRRNRLFFPERNVTMSALTEATVIVEAGETSGTLTQARAAIKQNRKLFILDSCFRNPALTWPARFEKQGAIRVREYDDIRKHLSAAAHQN